IEVVPHSTVYGDSYEDIARRVPDVTKMEHVLGVRADTPLREGLRRTVAWFRDAASKTGPRRAAATAPPPARRGAAPRPPPPPPPPPPRRSRPHCTVSASASQVAIKVDVDTYVGLRDGVPALARVLERRGLRASFFIACGPDHTGRALRRLVKPGFLAKTLRTNVPGTYGWRTLLYGTLLPGPQIARSFPQHLRALAD